MRFQGITDEEKIILEAIVAARKVQEFLCGKSDGSWGLDSWKGLLRKRLDKIEEINTDNPHYLVELKKRLLQNAALSIALMHAIDEHGEKIK